MKELCDVDGGLRKIYSLAGATFAGNRLTYKGRDILFSNGQLTRFSTSGDTIYEDFSHEVGVTKEQDKVIINFPKFELTIRIVNPAHKRLEVFTAQSISDLVLTKTGTGGIIVSGGMFQTETKRWDYSTNDPVVINHQTGTYPIQNEGTFETTTNLNMPGDFYDNNLSEGYDQVEAQVNYKLVNEVPQAVSNLVFFGTKWYYEFPAMTVHYGEKPETTDVLQYLYEGSPSIELF